MSDQQRPGKHPGRFRLCAVDTDTMWTPKVPDMGKGDLEAGLPTSPPMVTQFAPRSSHQSGRPSVAFARQREGGQLVPYLVAVG